MRDKRGRERERGEGGREGGRKIKPTLETMAIGRFFFVRHVRFFYRLSSDAAIRFSAIIIRLIIYSADKSDRQASNAIAAADLRVVPARRADNLIKAKINCD